MGGPVTALNLSVAIANLNTRIRSRGLSAREMWYQRDQFSNQQIPICDQELIQTQHQLRKSNHPYSVQSKTGHELAPQSTQVDVGDLVYLYSDRDKTRARNRYLVTSVDGSWCNIRKFTGAQLRNASYRVKKSECYKVPCLQEYTSHTPHRGLDTDYASDEDAPLHVAQGPKPPDPPIIPPDISAPAADSVNTGESDSRMADRPIDTTTHEQQSSSPQLALSDTSPITSGLRRSERQRKPPPHLRDYILK